MCIREKKKLEKPLIAVLFPNKPTMTNFGFNLFVCQKKTHEMLIVIYL